MRGFLPDQTRLAQVHLSTASCDRAMTFYSDVLGLKVVRSAGRTSLISAGPNQPPLLVLTESDAPPRQPRSVTGVDHFAFRYPTRNDLARACRRVLQAGYPITGAADHGVSEAVYLRDPDGHGVELCADRPRSQWPRDHGAISIQKGRLHLDRLVAKTAAEPSPGLTPEVELGHIHLRVGDLAEAEQFYSDYLGFTVTRRSSGRELFFAAGGYHHHVGVEVVNGQHVAKSGDLISYRLEVPLAEILYCLNHRAPLLDYEARMSSPAVLQIRDPNGFWLEVRAAASANSPGPGVLACSPAGNPEQKTGDL